MSIIDTSKIRIPFIANCGQDPGSTYLGGSSEEGWIYGGMMDNAIADDGSVLIAGLTESTDFPVKPGCYECPACGSKDIFIARFNADLSDLLSVTVVGGSGDDLSPRICIYDGCVYLTGIANSADYPTTPGCFGANYAGNGDIIVSKFDLELTTLLASTYIGSPGFDGYSSSLAIDDSGNVFVTSSTSDDTFPTTAGSYSQSIAGLNDCFIARLSSDLSSLTAGTFIGGRYDEKAGVIALTADGNVVLGTASESDDYPTTSGAYERDFHGPPQPGNYIHDVVISILNNDLDSLIASTYVGASIYEGASMMDIGTSGSIYVGGHTTSIDYPTSPEVFDPVHNGITEFFITRMSADLTTLEASTFCTPDMNGEWGSVFRTDIVCNTGGSIFLTGMAFDDSAFCTRNACDTTFNGGAGDIHVLVLTDDLTAAEYATYLGGSGDEGDPSVAIDTADNIYIASYTTSTDFPMTSGGWQPGHGGGNQDCVVSKLSKSYLCGDANNDGQVNVGDAVFLINYVFKGGDPPDPQCVGDANGDGGVNVGDAVYLIAYVFKGGPAPIEPCCP